MKVKASTFIKCEFCSNPDGAQYATIDRIFICQTCHEVLLQHGVGSNEAQIGSRRQSRIKKRTVKIFGTHYRSRRSPFSRTKADLYRKSTRLGYGLFLLGTISLWLLVVMSLITLVVTLIAAIIIARQYRVEQLSKFANTIQAELDEDQRLSDDRLDKLQKLVSESVQSEAAKPSPRYIEIMNHANEKGIPLWEYYVNGYPPDWEFRTTKVKERDGCCCQNCGRTEHLQVHHKKPVGGGGTHHLFNLISLCRSCHVKQHPSVIKSKLARREKQGQ